MIELKEVTKSYGDVTPIKDLNLQIEWGEFISIVGPSGSGKTTLLNMIAGLSTPSHGEVVIEGVSFYGLNLRDRAAFRRENFGFVFQTFNLIPYFTALENVQVPLYLLDRDVGEEDQRILAEDLLWQVGLKDKNRRLPAQLSMGEQQRVAIARAWANEPKVIFADEPTGNLDTETSREVMSYMERLHEEGVTILLVTHDSQVADIAQRKITLAEGRLVS